MPISLDGFVAGPNGEMNWIKVDEEIFDHIGKRSVYCPPLAGEVVRSKSIYKLGWTRKLNIPRCCWSPDQQH